MSKINANEYKTFGRRTAFLRERENLSQTQMAEIMNIPQSTYSGYETGNRKVPLNIVKKVAQYFSVSIDYLLSESDIAEEPIIAATKQDDNEDWTEEELEYIELVKKMLLEKRKSK